jgi:hypothetical protein
MARKTKSGHDKTAEDKKLDEELEGTFPASDPPSMTEPATHADPPRKPAPKSPKK